jgi:hypothetical protein
LEEAKEPIWIRRADVCFGSRVDGALARTF